MELQTKNGLELVKTEDVKRYKEIQSFIPVVRNAVSKAWRLLDRLLKMMEQKEEVK